jgi:hypothetical protein
MGGNRELVLEDSFNGSNGKSVFHANAALAQTPQEVQELWRKAVKWTIIVHILRLFSILFSRDAKTH